MLQDVDPLVGVARVHDLCRFGSSVTYFHLADGGAEGSASLQYGISSIFANPEGSAYAAIKSSNLDAPPGCAVWTYKTAFML